MIDVVINVECPIALVGELMNATSCNNFLRQSALLFKAVQEAAYHVSWIVGVVCTVVMLLNDDGRCNDGGREKGKKGICGAMVNYVRAVELLTKS